MTAEAGAKSPAFTVLAQAALSSQAKLLGADQLQRI